MKARVEAGAVVALIASIYSLVANVIRIFESTNLKVFHIIVSLASLYFTIGYMLIIVGIVTPETFGADSLRLGLIVLMACLGTFALAYRRRG